MAKIWWGEARKHFKGPGLVPSLALDFVIARANNTILRRPISLKSISDTKANGLVDRVHLGQRVQTLTNSLLLPRPPPTSIALNLLPVQTKLKQSEVYVVRLLVTPVENERQFKVHNVENGEGEGIFFRRGSGPQFNSTGVKKLFKQET